jgi:hypothetical protein
MKTLPKASKIKLAFFILLGCFSSLNIYSQQSSESYKVIAKDAAWCWFSDPRAIYHKGIHEKIYYASINSKGDVMINSRDENSKVIESFNLHEKLQIDDHNVPTILILPDGKILTFYTEHNGKFFMRKSKNAEYITSWEEERILSFGLKDELITYSHPVMLSGENNRIYMFFRNRSKKIPNDPAPLYWTQNYAYSDDLGASWSDAKIYLDSQREYTKVNYLKIVSDNQSKIHFLFTDGHPKISFSSVYHMYYEKGKFHQTGGEILADLDQIPLNISNINKLYDVEQGKTRSWIWDIALNKKGNPVVAYTRYPTVLDHIYHYAKWNGKKWIDYELINSGKYITEPEKNGKVAEEHYSGGVVLDHHRPNNVYLSRQLNGRFEIEHWALKGKKWKSTAITSNSSADNIRPYVLDGYTGKKPYVMWMNGRYQHYIRYNTDLLINEVK